MNQKMRTRAKWVIAVLALLTWLRPTVSHAERNAATLAEEAKANEFFYNGQYEEARRRYAKLLSDNPDETIYLRNLARCNENLGNLDEAIRLFQSYLRESKDLSPNEQAEVKGFVANLEARQAQGAKPPAAALPPLPPPPSSPPPPVSGPVMPPPTGPPPPYSSSPVAAGGDHGGGLRIAGIAAGGLGVVLVAVGAYYGAQASDAAHEIETKAVPGTSYNTSLKAIDDRGRSDETKQWVLLGAGAGSLIGAGVLYYLGTRGDESGGASPSPPGTTAMTLAPAISSRSLGALLRGTF
jgi:tetratricopeptide (TPR) repeat protein